VTALRRIPSRALPPLALHGLTLTHVASGLRYRLGWSEARCLAEAIYQALGHGGQIATRGWVVSYDRARKHLTLDGRRFDLPLVTLTHGQAVAIGTGLAQTQRIGVVA
jgi:hypothetical protein